VTRVDPEADPASNAVNVADYVASEGIVLDRESAAVRVDCRVDVSVGRVIDYTRVSEFQL
jgi:hypothetical protein